VGLAAGVALDDELDEEVDDELDELSEPDDLVSFPVEVLGAESEEPESALAGAAAVFASRLSVR
jgi:hypothetical protein